MVGLAPTGTKVDAMRERVAVLTGSSGTRHQNVPNRRILSEHSSYAGAYYSPCFHGEYLIFKTHRIFTPTGFQLVDRTSSADMGVGQYGPCVHSPTHFGVTLFLTPGHMKGRTAVLALDALAAALVTCASESAELGCEILQKLPRLVERLCLLKPSKLIWVFSLVFPFLFSSPGVFFSSVFRSSSAPLVLF